MAIALEFIDLVVPIRTLEEKYSGGWRQCLADHAPRGFEAEEVLNDGRVWKDVCVVQWIFGGATMPCDWVVDRECPFAVLKGTEPVP